MSTGKFPQVGIGVLVLRGDELLLGKRIAGHGSGTWQSAGGHLEFGEDFVTAAHREVQEEVGITISDVHLLTVTNDMFMNEGKHYVTVFMTCAYCSGKPIPQEPDKCSEWRWFPLNKLPENLFLPYGDILKKHKLPPSSRGQQ